MSTTTTTTGQNLQLNTVLAAFALLRTQNGTSTAGEFSSSSSPSPSSSSSSSSATTDTNAYMRDNVAERSSSFAPKSVISSTWFEFLYRLHTETTIGSDHVMTFIDRHWHVTIYLAAIYLALVLAGTAYMRRRPPYNLRAPLAAWSALLAIFSLIGSVRVLPEFWQLFASRGIVATYCDNRSFTADPTLLYWYTIFVLSKTIELIDTAFIVLRKQKLITLHWVHHALTMCFCFYVHRDAVSTARWMVGMNFPIHALMYTYYSLKALRIHIPRIISVTITAGQIVQMIFGFYIHTHVLAMKLFSSAATAEQCKCSLRGSVAGFALYALFFYYFVQFFYETYIVGKRKTTTTAATTTTKTTKSNIILNDQKLSSTNDESATAAAVATDKLHLDEKEESEIISNENNNYYDKNSKID